MIVLKRIIGWETPKDNLESQESRPVLPDVDEARPDACPSCLGPAREEGKLTLQGHGSYQRWVKAPEQYRAAVRRFRCIRPDCGKTCSVLPHWMLPRFQYTAPLVLTSLLQYHVSGETAGCVTAPFGLSEAKNGWGTLRRWGGAFLVSAILWGWLGPRLGVGNGAAGSRDRVRVHLERFMRYFSDRVHPHAPASIADIVGLSLNGRLFDRGKAGASLHAPNGSFLASGPQKPRFGPPTQDGGSPRGPP